MSPELAISNRNIILKGAQPPGKLCQTQQTSKRKRCLPSSAQLSKQQLPTQASLF